MIAAAWIECRRYDKAAGTSKQRCIDLLDFRCEVTESLLNYDDAANDESEEKMDITFPKKAK